MKIEKSLPHNFLAEKAVLNCLILNSELIETTFHNLSIDAFYFKNHQEIYKILIFMYKNNKPIDIITLNTFVQDKGLLKKIGIRPFLSSCSASKLRRNSSGTVVRQISRRAGRPQGAY